MIFLTLALTIFGPFIGELIKRLLFKIFPNLPKEQRALAHKELRQTLKGAFRKDKQAPHGYSAVCGEDALQAKLEALEAKYSVG